MSYTSQIGYNVLMYGLKGDGTTDDSTAFNTLINTTAPAGSQIFFPSGTYIINGISTAKVFEYYGNGIASIIKASTNTTSLTLTTGSDKSTFTNLKFLGTGSGAAQNGIYFNSSGYFNISNCTFQSFGNVAIQVSDIENSNELGGIINDCRFFSNGYGVDIINRGEYVTISNSAFVLNTNAIRTIGGNTLIIGNYICYNTNGIELASGTNNAHGVISGNQINHQTGNAINLHDFTVGQTVANNHIIVGTLRVANCTGLTITGGQINVDAITFDTNVGLTIQGVRLPGTLNNTITLTGTAPTYINCLKLDGSYAYDIATFGATLEKSVTTTDATVTTLQTIPATASSTITVSGYVTARRTGGASGTAEDGATYRVEFSIKNVSGTATIIGQSITVIGESQAGWDVTLTGSSANILIQVTGASGNNITWKWTTIQYVKV